MSLRIIDEPIKTSYPDSPSRHFRPVLTLDEDEIVFEVRPYYTRKAATQDARVFISATLFPTQESAEAAVESLFHRELPAVLALSENAKRHLVNTDLPKTRHEAVQAAVLNLFIEKALTESSIVQGALDEGILDTNAPAPWES